MDSIRDIEIPIWAAAYAAAMEIEGMSADDCASEATLAVAQFRSEQTRLWEAWKAANPELAKKRGLPKT